MKKDRMSIQFATVLLMLFAFCAASAWASEGASPASVAKKFAKAYYMLDESMADYLSEDAVDMVDLYLDRKEYAARNQGYKLSYFQMRPLNMKAKALEQDENTAKVEITATNIRSINPLFRIVGFVFCLLDQHDVKETITLVQEDGEWKVGPGALGLPVPM